MKGMMAIGRAAVLAAGLMLTATPAAADTISLDSTKVGQSYNFTFNGFSDGTVINGLSSVGRFTLTSVTPTSYSFSYSFTNTTGDPLDSRLSGFAFNTDPTISGASATGAFSYTTLNGNYPNGIGTVDACFKAASTGSCAGGGGGGLFDGQTGTGTLTLNFASPITALSLSDFFVRYQSITGAGNVTSASGAGTLTGSSGGTPVPEPGMLGLLGSAMIGMALLRRRRRQPVRAAALA